MRHVLCPWAQVTATAGIMTWVNILLFKGCYFSQKIPQSMDFRVWLLVSCIALVRVKVKQTGFNSLRFLMRSEPKDWIKPFAFQSCVDLQKPIPPDFALSDAFLSMQRAWNNSSERGTLPHSLFLHKLPPGGTWVSPQEKIHITRLETPEGCRAVPWALLCYLIQQQFGIWHWKIF